MTFNPICREAGISLKAEAEMVASRYLNGLLDLGSTSIRKEDPTFVDVDPLASNVVIKFKDSMDSLRGLGVGLEA